MTQHNIPNLKMLEILENDVMAVVMRRDVIWFSNFLQDLDLTRSDSTTECHANHIFIKVLSFYSKRRTKMPKVAAFLPGFWSYIFIFSKNLVC